VSGRLALVRHGQTASNLARVLDTALPGAPLTELGVAQAKAFGAALTSSPAGLYCSQALRARQTAEYIGAQVGVTPTVLDGLHEIQVGELEGRGDPEAHDVFTAVYHAWHTGDLSARTPGGESGRDVLDRYLPVIELLRCRHFDNVGASTRVIVVSHGSAIRLTARYLADVDPVFSANHQLDNTGTVELAPTPTGWTVLRWGDTDELTGDH
jgi:probable phosphoglycerate mutase